jgi:hypothetical protein
MESEFIRIELKLATNLGARIVPVLIEPIPDRLLLAEEIRNLQWVDCTADQTDIAIDRLVHDLLTRKSERPNTSG